jgi:lysophospholipase L1-like esterase
MKAPPSALRVALLAVLVASLSGNVLLARAAYNFFNGMTAVRLDPVGLDVYAADRAAPPAGGPLLVFFGDSRAAMWPEPATPTGYRILNHGIGYQTTAQILMRVEEDVAHFHPSIVVLEAGVNDLKAIAQFPQQRAKIVSDCEANIQRIVDSCRRAGATVVLVTIFDIGDLALWRRPVWSGEVAAAVREVNAYLPTLAAEHVAILDAGPILDDVRGKIQGGYQLDYLHLSPAGYSALNRRLVPFLASLPK